MRFWLSLICILFCSVTAASATPASDAAWKDCQAQNENTRIAGCSTIIAAQGFGSKKRLADAYDGRCWAFHATGRYDEAVKDCLQSIAIYPKSAYVFHNLGVAYSGLRNFGTAIAAFDQALALNPKQTRSLLGRGRAYEAMGRPELAKADYQAAVVQNSNNAEAVGLLAALNAAPNRKPGLAGQPIAVVPSPTPTAPPAPAKSSSEMTWDYVSITTRQRTEVGRRALLIANDDYRHIGKLDGPGNDVQATASLLKQLGFETSILLNPTKGQFLSAIRESSRSERSGVALMIYYSGHAAAVNGENTILLPNFDPKLGLDVDNSLSLKVLMNELGNADFEKILVAFDACRNAVKVPTEQVAAAQRTSEVRAVRGLQLSSAEMQSLRRKEYSILFSTSEGEFALDTGTDGLSPFTKAFNTALRSEQSFISAMVLTKRITEQITQSAQSPTIEIKWNSDLAYGKAEKFASSARYESEFKQTPANTAARELLSRRTVPLDQGWRVAKMLALDSSDSPACNRTDQPFVWQVSYLHLIYCDLNRLGFERVDTYPQDSVSDSKLYDGAEWTFDLDYDGKAETFTVSNSRYGHHLTIKSQSGQTEFIGTVGPNIETIATYDFNLDGVLDVLLVVDPGGTLGGRQIIILDGRKIVAGLRDVEDCARKTASKGICTWQRALGSTMKESVFEPTQYSEAGMYNLLQKALFVDWMVKDLKLVPDGTLVYTTYGSSWQSERKGDDEGGREKRVRFRKGDAKFVVSYGYKPDLVMAPVYDYLKSAETAASYGN